MKKRAGTFLLLAVFLPLSCTPEEDPIELKVQERITQGKAYLGESNYEDALATFEEVLEKYDSDNPEAKWGVIMSTNLRVLANLGDVLAQYLPIIYDFMGGEPIEFAPQQSSPQACAGQPYGLNLIIENVMNEMLLDGVNYLIPLVEEMKNYPNFTMTIEKCPVQVKIEPLLSYYMDIGGEWDEGDIYFLSAALKFFKGVAYTVYAVNLGLSTESMAEAAGQFLPMLTSGEPLTMDRDFLMGILAEIIATSPELMVLEPQCGASRLAEAAGYMADAIDDLFAFLDAIQAETDDQTDDVIGYREESNKVYAAIKFKDEGGAPHQIRVEYSESIIQSFERIQSSYRSSGGIRASWAQDLAPFFGFLVEGTFQSGVPTSIIELVLPLLGDYIGPEIVDMALGMMDSLTDMATRGILAGAMTMIIPDVLELDFGKFFNNPPDQFLRLVMPATVTADSGTSLLIEYECEDSLGPEDFFCPYPEAVSSAPHFLGTDYEIPDDYFANPLPYLTATDPSIGGLLYLNLYRMDRTQFANEYVRPDVYQFNYFVGNVFGNLIGGLF